jgi:XisI protein
MDKITRYQQIIEDILREYGSYKPSFGDVEVEIIADAEKGHYQLMTVGWHGQHRIHGCQMHVDIKGGKVWIQHDGTEEGIANRLVAAGVPREDIVLAFHSPFMRKFTDFAVK